MNTVNIDNEEFKNTETYQDFIRNNPSIGRLRINAFSASQAIPVSGLKIIVSKVLNNYNVVFFEGYTDLSGMIERIELPAPKSNVNNLDAPISTTYDVTSTYDNIDKKYSVKMYDDVCVVQNINVKPMMDMRGRSYGS